jgi:hypothetical protein
MLEQLIEAEMGIDSLPDDYLQQRYAPFEIKDTL